MFTQDPTRFLGSKNLNLDPPTGLPLDLQTSKRKTLEGLLQIEWVIFSHFYRVGSVQVRTLSPKYSSSRNP